MNNTTTTTTTTYYIILYYIILSIIYYCSIILSMTIYFEEYDINKLVAFCEVRYQINFYKMRRVNKIKTVKRKLLKHKLMYNKNGFILSTKLLILLNKFNTKTQCGKTECHINTLPQDHKNRILCKTCCYSFQNNSLNLEQYNKTYNI